MNGKLGLALILAAAAGMAAGCGGSGTTSAGGSGDGALADSTMLTAQARPPIPDVPMPVDFRMDEDRGYSSDTPGVRTIGYIFHGNKDKFAVARFFRAQMQQAGWARVSESEGWSVKTMDFTKGNESCRITLQDGPIFVKTEVRVQVFPGARAGQTDTIRK